MATEQTITKNTLIEVYKYLNFIGPLKEDSSRVKVIFVAALAL